VFIEQNNMFYLYVCHANVYLLQVALSKVQQWVSAEPTAPSSHPALRKDVSLFAPERATLWLSFPEIFHASAQRCCGSAFAELHPASERVRAEQRRDGEDPDAALGRCRCTSLLLQTAMAGERSCSVALSMPGKSLTN